MEAKIYTYFLPIIGLIIPIVIILFGAILFGPKKVKEPDEVSKTWTLLSPFKDAPWWTWIIAIIGYAPFIVHSVELWNPDIVHIREFVDIAFMITVFSFFIACFVTTYKHGKKKRGGNV